MKVNDSLSVLFVLKFEACRDYGCVRNGTLADCILTSAHCILPTASTLRCCHITQTLTRNNCQACYKINVLAIFTKTS